MTVRVTIRVRVRVRRWSDLTLTLAHLLDEGLELVDDLLECLGRVRALGGLLLEEGVHARVVLVGVRVRVRVMVRVRVRVS